MKNKENEQYVKLGVTLAIVVIVGLMSYFFMIGFRKNGGVPGKILSILKPFVYGAVIAYIATPLCRRLERMFSTWFKGKNDKLAASLAIGVSIITEIIVIMAVLLLIIPQLIDSISGLAEVLPGQIVAARANIEALLNDPPPWLAWVQQNFGDLNEKLNLWFRSDFPSLTRSMLTSAVPKLTGAFGVVYHVLLGQIVAVYLLARRKQLGAQLKLLVHGTLRPAWAEWVVAETKMADRLFNGFFMGKLLDSAIIGILCFIGCLAMGFGSPVLIAVIVGVTNIVPFFGPLIGAVPCGLLLLLENPMHCLMFVIFVIVLQQLDGNVIGPRILGNTTGLSGLWVMFGILLFGGLWGISGMIVGVPLMALIYDLVRQIAFRGVRKRGMEDMLDDYQAKYHPAEKK